MDKRNINGMEVYRQLIGAIEKHELQPGDRLREAELAEKYGVSRTPIREALKRLEAQRIAVHEPNCGMVIASLSHDQVTEIYFMREVLEGTAARLAAQHASQTEIDVLRELVAEDKQHVEDEDWLLQSNREFHRRLYLASHNRYLVDQTDHLRLSLLLLAGRTLATAERRELAVGQHEAIVEAIAERDCDKADTVARAHIAGAHKARITSSL
ncbi:MAG: GntR family transcriptional regulator [Stappiaceae bacterium]